MTEVRDDEEEDDGEENSKEEYRSKEAVERSNLIHDCIKNRYNLEWDRTKVLDGKASGIISFVGIILALQGGIGAILIKDVPKTGMLYVIMNEIFILSILCLTFSILCGLRAYNVQSWLFVPEVNKFIEACKNPAVSQISILEKLDNLMAISIDKSKKINEQKVNFVLYGLVSLVAGLVLNLFFIIGLVIMVNY